MNAFRRQSLVFVLLLAIAALIAVWWGRNQFVDDVPAGKTGIPLITLKQSTLYQFDEQGTRDLILSSEQVRHFQNQKGTEFTQPELTRLQADATSTLRADFAVQNAQQTQIRMRGEVHATHTPHNKPDDITTFTSPTLTYYVPENEAETDDPVVITTRDSITHATGSLWHLNQNLFILKKNIRSDYASDSH